ncbi:hypothetical protein [Massilia sp. X63]|uniref:hypothetical protein n=1 Tax=Massilia sp. X63 TaxID=3237285 RepID=UPI0034DD91DD
MPETMPIPTELLAPITERLSPGGEPGNADDAAQVWQCLFAKFRPLIGPLSTNLLFARTLLGHAGAFPWLAALPGLDGAQDAHQTFAAFLRHLRDQPPEQIVAVNRALVTDYAAALAELIGERLASRFLVAAFAPGDAHKNI